VNEIDGKDWREGSESNKSLIDIQFLDAIEGMKGLKITRLHSEECRTLNWGRPEKVERETTIYWNENRLEIYYRAS